MSGYPSPDKMRSLTTGVAAGVGASQCAHKLSKKRVVSQSVQTPTTPVEDFVSTPTGGNPYREANVFEDLQLAAELGKTLLERNRELENTIRHQQSSLDDQLQEIEYLSKQTAALREVNDSRLRIYEQLEISIQELESSNQRLSAENAADKKKIKDLTETVEVLEGKCEDLQRSLEEAQTQRSRNRRRIVLPAEEEFTRRSQSCENTHQVTEERSPDEPALKSTFEDLEEKVRSLQVKLAAETRRKEEVEIELACSAQENNILHQQLAVMKDKEINFKTLDEEISSIDGSSSGRLCHKCLNQMEETSSNPTVDLNESIEDTDLSIDSVHGECALIKLKNGGYVWGSQESLASLGHVVSHVSSAGTSPTTENSDPAPHDSLLSELDTQYRILIDKYESLLQARESKQEATQLRDVVAYPEGDQLPPHDGDDVAGPVRYMITTKGAGPLQCHRCDTCTCDLKLTGGAPKNVLDDFSEVETSSSGFSEGESRSLSKTTQTDEAALQDDEESPETPTLSVGGRLHLESLENPCENRFEAVPEYKKLFEEIFSVLKKTVGEKDHKMGLKTKAEATTVAARAEADQGRECDSAPQRILQEEESEAALDEGVLRSRDHEEKTADSALGGRGAHSAEGSQPDILQCVPKDKKHPRPASLQLSHSSSRSSSRHRRRRRNRLRPEAASRSEDKRIHVGRAQLDRKSKDSASILSASQPRIASALFYASSTRRCEHHRSRRPKQADRQRPEGDGKEATGEDEAERNPFSEDRSFGSSQQPRSYALQRNKISFPSVEVARLRKLELTYAEALKSTLKKVDLKH